MVDGLALSVELTTKHLSGDGHLQHVASEFAVSMRVVNFGGTLKNLDDGFLSADFKNLALSGLSVSELNVYDLCIPGELNVVKDD